MARSGGPQRHPAGRKERDAMDKDEVKGKGNEGTGTAKETAGKLTGDRETEARGKADQAKGKGEGAMGKAKDAVGDAADKLKDKVS